MKSRFTVVLVAICIGLASTGLLNATTPGTAKNVQLVGQNPLFGRGMNAAGAIYKHFLYVGNRTDGSSRCGVGDPRRTTTGLNSGCLADECRSETALDELRKAWNMTQEHLGDDGESLG
jgi:hypothetical protein